MKVEGKRFLCGALLAVMALGNASAQTEVTDFQPGVTLDGVNYFLPKTALRVVLVAEKSVTTPGEFAPYANRYLRLTDVPTAEETEWKIKEVQIRTFGTPDPTKAYNIKLRAKTSAPLVSLTSDGLLLAVNTDTTEPAEEPLPQAVPAPAPLNGRDFMTQTILSAGSTAKMAQLTAEEIYDLRESRSALIRGEADNTPKDGAQLKLMLDNLDHQLAALEALFKGQTRTSTEVLTLDYVPTSEDLGTGSCLIGRFSRRLGLVDADDLSGEPLWLDLRPVGSLPAIVEDADTDRKKAKMESGIRVNQPARVKTRLALADKELVTSELAFGQFGTVEVLSDVLFNKKLDTHVVLFQQTGSVRQISNDSGAGGN